MRFVAKYSLFFLLPLGVLGQSADTVYTTKYLRKSTSFAWTTFGADLLTLGGGNTDYQSPEGTVRATSLSPTTIPRLTIGGIHFWGHADFYVSFPLPIRWSSRPDAFSVLRYTHGIETGVRIYPLRLAPERISPYVGASFRMMSYGHQTAGTNYTHGFPEVERMAMPLQAGLTYTTPKYLMTTGVHYHPKSTLSYPISPTAFGSTSLSPVSITIGLIRYIDTDRSMASPNSIAQLNRKHELLKRHNRLSAWYTGIGPSAAMPRPLGRSSYIQHNYPYLRGEAIGGFMPDLTVGRYFYKPDLNIGLSYRTMGAHISGFDADLRFRRHSFMVETYKYLFNYLGFAPYLGSTVSLEQLSMNDNERRHIQIKPSIGLIFGWDIRVTNTGTSLLRTNLRWIPNLKLTVGAEQIMFDNIEFNFIQYVYFFGRNGVYQKYRSR